MTEARPTLVAVRWDRDLAGVLSILLAGGGQMYLGRTARGASMLALQVTSICIVPYVGPAVLLLPLAIIVWSVIDARMLARTLNDEQIRLVLSTHVVEPATADEEPASTVTAADEPASATSSGDERGNAAPDDRESASVDPTRPSAEAGATATTGRAFAELLRRLHGLHAQGILSEREYAERKHATIEGLRAGIAEDALDFLEAVAPLRAEGLLTSEDLARIKEYVWR